jgi:hypothetical protein
MRNELHIDDQIGDAENTQVADDNGSEENGANESKYLTTIEAAKYMRRSRGWILNRKDIPYYRGKPNLYLKRDLDTWLDSFRRYEPLEMRRRL